MASFKEQMEAMWRGEKPPSPIGQLLGFEIVAYEKGSALYTQGLAWLSTSRALSVQYHTGQGEAATRLTELVSPNEADWPAPAATPLLNSTSAAVCTARVTVLLRTTIWAHVARSDASTELFAMAPLLTKEAYCQIGSNAARHARGKPSSPVAVKVDNMARLRLIVHALLMHKREVACVQRGRPATDMEIVHDA